MSTQDDYVLYSAFVKADETMKEMDLLADPYDFSEIDAEPVPDREKTDRKERAKRALWALFDWQYPIRIYRHAHPRIIQVGLGAVREKAIPNVTALYEEMRSAGGILAGSEIRDSAVLIQFYYSPDADSKPSPVLYLYTGIQLPDQRAQIGGVSGKVPIPYWISSFARRTPLQVLREGALCAKLITTSGIESFLHEARVGALLVESLTQKPVEIATPSTKRPHRHTVRTSVEKRLDSDQKIKLTLDLKRAMDGARMMSSNVSVGHRIVGIREYHARFLGTSHLSVPAPISDHL